MTILTIDHIRNKIANSPVIYQRGENIYRLGNYMLKEFNPAKARFVYSVDGEYGDYEITISVGEGKVVHSCTCPFPRKGCKHTVAACLDAAVRLSKPGGDTRADTETTGDYLGFDEIRDMALESRVKKAKAERFTVTRGDTYKGEHLVTTAKGKHYLVTIYDPIAGTGHCTCPDYQSNHLGACKHTLHLLERFRSEKNFSGEALQERLTFAHFYWDAYSAKPKYYAETDVLDARSRDVIDEYFDPQGIYKRDNLCDFFEMSERLKEHKAVRVDEFLYYKVQQSLFDRELESVRKKYKSDYSQIRTELYPYQKEGVDFGLFKKSVVIADEMGLGKTLQAIALALLKRELFGFSRALIISPSSLKEQWRREIAKFTGENAVIVSGARNERQKIYETSNEYFVITNYEAVLRDILSIRRSRPDLVILDEAQRIRNFETRTHEAVSSIPRRQSVVLTGTPLENKLEDLYSIIQFADPEMLSPLWLFAAEHYLLDRRRQSKVKGYKNLDGLNRKLKNVVIRRKREDVLDSLPDQVTNNYYIELTAEQYDIHQGYARMLLPILAKKFHTPMDIKRIHQILTSMRMVCNSTYLIDRKTNLSPKLLELQSILSDIVIGNGRKTVMFTEWTTMTYLIGNMLSGLGIPFVEFTGRVPVAKRQDLVGEFMSNPECRVFLSTDAGGVGLNLQNADCVINVELPWNPARLSQRIGRVMRIGQKSASVNVINLIARRSIEESVLAGIHMKQDLFNAVIEGEGSSVEFSREKKEEFISGLRAMFNEDSVLAGREHSPTEEISPSTPYFLNPEVLLKDGTEVDIEAEETADILEQEDVRDINQPPRPAETVMEEAPGAVDAAPETMEKLEGVLEQGIAFLSGIMRVATGKPLVPESDSKKISIDRETGEVVIRFKLPGIGA
ncbi:MAG: DEAD/DEAH box helicase [Spirochaetota bacterium]|nr:DEAD/DEAH box helicase [Spirochaetota bacterium]OPZ35661.1 MAG: ATP-dependent RNA helicase DbpA [Spirochaetes bacterium ADurb.BinA120]HPI15225.1 DEAD/DEAH box helicase [Spirochaetota bacterium]HPV99265.1 DEAD/DEAH box helicase [Spirochaetota bacterium]